MNKKVVLWCDRNMENLFELLFSQQSECEVSISINLLTYFMLNYVSENILFISYFYLSIYLLIFLCIKNIPLPMEFLVTSTKKTNCY